MPISDQSALTKAEQRKLLAPPVGQLFDPYERVFGYFDNGTVFDYGEFDAADIATMLRRDGKARSLEQVLTLPLRGAAWKIEPEVGDSGQAKLCQDNLGSKLGKIIDQMTTAETFRRAFFETTWTLDAGRIVYDCIEWRPPTGCEAGFDPRTGAPKGFRQRIVPVAGFFPPTYDSMAPGYVIIKPDRAFVYTHGSYREPVKGISDLDVAYWCWETKQKVLFLLFQFLENQSLPKVVVYGDSIDQATELAGDVASLKSSGVLGLPRPGDPTGKAFEVLESSGQGAGQFLQAVQYLDTMMVASVLAGFTELATAAASGTGSYALSADQSEFFLASRQAVADEMAEAVREGLFTPLVRNNFGPDAPVPKLCIGPLSNRSTERALAMLTSVVVAPQLNVPREFVDLLTQSVANFLGLDATKVEQAIAEEVKRREEADKLKLAQQQQLLANPIPQPGQPRTTGTPPPGKPAVPAKAGPPPPAVKLAHTVDVANQLVRRVQAGEDPQDVLTELALAAEPAAQHTGGMVALVPDAATAHKLAVRGPHAESAAELHLTLAYLGDDVTGWDSARRAAVIEAARTAADGQPPITARVFAHTTFNADGGPDGDREPCAVYGIGDSELLTPLHERVVAALAGTGITLPAQHQPYVPHVTAGYGMTAADLDYLGPVVFDAVVVAIGGQRTQIPLGSH